MTGCSELPDRPGHDGSPAWLSDTSAPDQLAWRDLALCAQADPDAFFPEKGASTREAKQLCAACTVRPECLDSTLRNDERFGVWGGLSERERSRLHRLAPASAAVQAAQTGAPRACPGPPPHPH